MSSEEEVRLEIENLDLRRLLAQAGIDAAEHKAAERLQRVLLEELHHRIKNTLASVMAITSQSLQNAESLESARQAISSRLLALGRVHDLLLKVNWSSAPLTEIVKSAIEPFDQNPGGRFLVQSSHIDVSPPAVLPLAMVLNELCTNALKYGSLSATNGRVEITATVDAARSQFRLGWVERGGPMVLPPQRRGFGSRLIERSFVTQLRGQAMLAFEPTGVVCFIDIPLASLVAPGSVRSTATEP